MRTALIITLLFFFSCSEKSKIKKSDILIKLGGTPDQVIRDFELKYYDSSRVKTVVSSKNAYIFDKLKYTILDTNVKAVFYKTNGDQVVSTLTSDSALVDDKSKNMYAFKNVIVYSDSTKTKLESAYLEWNEKKQKLNSTEEVTIDSPQETIHGIGFESDVNLNNYKIYKVNGIKKK